MEYSATAMTVILDGLTFEKVDFNIKHGVALLDTEEGKIDVLTNRGEV